MQLNYYKESWPLRPEVCPCDVDLSNFVRERQIRDKVIFHFGTGEHHLIGRQNMVLPKPNHILGVTASRGEYSAYIDFIIENPTAANYYKVLFTDIYSLSERMLPRFDLITLFHLCEFFQAKHSAYAPLNDKALLQLFVSRLQPHGRILFYARSAAARKMRRLVDELVETGKLACEGRYKTLLVYRPA